jgi:hypothetical protein
MADWIADCFTQCDRLFRLPFHEPMSAFKSLKDVGLTGGSPHYTPDDIISTWGLTAPVEQTILLTFGGLGLQQIPYHKLQYFPDWQFITFDDSASDLPNLLKITNHKYRPVDFMPVCGRVVSKPGYSTFAEALRLGVPIVSLTRQDFAEADLLIEGITNYAHHQILSQDEFFQGNWEFLKQSPTLPRQPQPLATDGNGAIAHAVRSYFETA